MPHLNGVEHHHVTVRGARIHYAEAGGGEPLVLQHGWPQHWWMWRNQIPALAKRYRVICPDLRGHGWSEATPRGYEKRELMEDAVALLDALGLERVRYAGHDWGAVVGFLLGMHHPERVERMVVMSVPHPWAGRPDPRRLAGLAHVPILSAPVLGRLAVERLGFTRLVLGVGRGRGSFSPQEVEQYEAAIREPGHPGATVQVYRTLALRELPRTVIGRSDVKRLRVPTLLLLGENDPSGIGSETGYEDHADDMRVVKIPDTSHFIPEEAPDEVLEQMEAHLAG